MWENDRKGKENEKLDHNNFNFLCHLSTCLSEPESTFISILSIYWCPNMHLNLRKPTGPAGSTSFERTSYQGHIYLHLKALMIIENKQVQNQHLNSSPGCYTYSSSSLGSQCDCRAEQSENALGMERAHSSACEGKIMKNL